MRLSARSVHQAAGIVVRRDARGADVLIVSGRRRRKRWLFPKGHVEAGERPADAALREVEEEAGVTGTMICPATTVVRRRAKVVIRTDYFLIAYAGPCGDGDGRRVKWERVGDAIGLLTQRDARDALRSVRAWVEGPR